MKPTKKMSYPLIIIIFLLSSLSPIYGNTGDEDYNFIQLSLNSGEYSIEKDVNNLDVLAMEDAFFDGDPGNPQLPYMIYKVLLPYDVIFESLDLEVINADYEEVEGYFDINPCSPICTYVDGEEICYWGSETIVDGKNIDVYESDSFYPIDSIFIKEESAQMRKWKFVRVYFYPFKYNPVQGKLYYCDNIEIKISYQTMPESMMDTVETQLILSDNAFDDIAAEMFVNYSQASNWYPDTLRPKIDVSYSKIPTVLNSDIISSSLIDTSYVFDYIIVTTNEVLINSTKIIDFLNHKASMGFSVGIATEDQYGTSTPENIREYLIYGYENWSFEYVLLIGDPDPNSSIVPMKLCHPGSSEVDNGWSPTDYYYAD